MNEPLITVVGWVGSEVDLSHTPGGHAVAEFRVASTPRTYRQGEWTDRPTVWCTVKCWRNLAENVAESVRQGQPVVVQGKLVQETWQTAEGRRGEKQVIVAGSVGHDLTHGLAQFRRSEQRRRAEPERGPGADVVRRPEGEDATSAA